MTGRFLPYGNDEDSVQELRIRPCPAPFVFPSRHNVSYNAPDMPYEYCSFTALSILTRTSTQTELPVCFHAWASETGITKSSG